jgi:hypothetical protein
MAEENEKKENRLVQETPEVEKPDVLSPETRTGTPPTPPSPAFERLTEKPETPPCQWFMNDMNFCEKIKKNVRCGGNVRKCPF